MSSITLPNDGNVKILAIDETFSGGAFKPALATGGLGVGYKSAQVSPGPILGSLTPSNADMFANSMSSPGQASSVVSIKLPVSSSRGMPSISTVAVDYAVYPRPGTDSGQRSPDPVGSTSLLSVSKDPSRRRAISIDMISAPPTRDSASRNHIMTKIAPR